MADNEKIIFRLAKLFDAEGMAAIFRKGLREKKCLYTGTNKYTAKKFSKLRSYLSSKDKNSGNRSFVAQDPVSKEILAFCSYTFRSDGRTKHEVQLGWSVGIEHFGKGIGTKIVKFALDDARKRGYRRAEAQAAVANVASWKLAMKLGFVIEGLKRKGLLLDNGNYEDVYVMGKLL